MEESSLPLPQDNVKRVAIIGGGAAGLATLHVFLEYQHQLCDDNTTWDIKVFERREDIGGIWLRSSNLPLDPNEPPPSAIYDCLTTNIPHPTMWFHNFPFPPSTHLFPSSDVVLRYINSYADHFDLRKYVQTCCRVMNAVWDSTQAEWLVDLSNGEKWSGDHLVVASGHYNTPRIPSTIDGLKDFKNILHSAWYRNPEPFLNKKVIVVGAGPSGRDISFDLVGGAREVLWSARTHTRSEIEDMGRKTRVGIRSVCSNGEVSYEDGSHDQDVDWIILATGYEFSYPFLSQVQGMSPPSGVAFPPLLYNSRSHIYPLAKQVFPLPPPSPPPLADVSSLIPPTALAFIGLPYRLSPLPLFEAQALVAIRLFSSSLTPFNIDLDRERRMITDRRKQILLSNPGIAEDEVLAKMWHRLPDLEQFDYRKELVAFSVGYDDDKVTEMEKKGWRADEWIIQTYMKKDIIRNEWKDVVACGEADEFVRGIGTNDEWREAIERLLQRAERRKGGKTTSQETASELDAEGSI